MARLLIGVSVFLNWPAAVGHALTYRKWPLSSTANSP